MQNVLRRNMMFPNRAWNRQGPHIPGWFRRRLVKIDRTLVLQFMPPMHPLEFLRAGGVDCRLFPDGLWAVCRKLPRSGMLLKKFVWTLTGVGCRHTRPSFQTLRIIRKVRNLARQNRTELLDRRLDSYVARMAKEEKDEGRAWLADRIVKACRAHEITKSSLGRPTVSMHVRSTNGRSKQPN